MDGLGGSRRGRRAGARRRVQSRDEEFFSAMRGKGAFLNDKPIAASKKSTLDGALLIASGGLFKKKIWKEPWPEVKTRWVNSVAYRLALVACGRGRRHHLALGQDANGTWPPPRSSSRRPAASITDHHGEAHLYNSSLPALPEPRRERAKARIRSLIERTNRVDL